MVIMCFSEGAIKKKYGLTLLSHVYQKVNVSVAILGCLNSGQIKNNHNGLFESWLLKRKK